jgi:hypothetical protein
LKIGSYRVGVKSPGGIAIAVLVWVYMLSYLYGSRHLLDDEALSLVRILFVLLIPFTIAAVKEDLSLVKLGSEADVPQKKKAASMNPATQKVIVFAALMVGYLVGIQFLGFIISTLLFPAGMMYYLGSRNVKVLVFVPIVLTAAMYFMFNMWLFVTLPVGIFGI